jgi:hypothetical protein
MSLTNIEKQRRYRERQKEKGFKLVQVWVPETVQLTKEQRKQKWIIDQINAMDDEELKKITAFIKTIML